ncbi:MAG: heavy metal translocating P-type ATPase [Microscillaceae bacterium]|jgi:Cu2+-exporting ATPase|nr:heavy metal translocating P-type ATPase [Microscillaceae bacterium]
MPSQVSKTSTIRQTFPVLEMSCAACAASVESVIQSQNGVLSAQVNYATATVNVEYQPQVASPEVLKKALQSAGYDLLLVEKNEQGESQLQQIQQNKLKKLQNRTFWAIVLALPVVGLGMFGMDLPYGNYIMWVLSTPIIGGLGKDFFVNAWKQARHRTANMDTLVALSTGVAYLFSVFNTLFPHFWHARGLHAHVYFEAAVVVIAFILLGKLLEERAKSSTSTALKKLIGLQPKTVNQVLDNEQIIEISIEQIKIGDVLLVKPGEKIAVDGVVLQGESFVDESMLTGESMPIHKTADNQVFAGTINQKGSFRFRAEKVGGDTMLAQIIRMVQEAQGSKAPVQKLVDKIAGVFVPIVVAIAVFTLLIWLFVGGENGFNQGLLAMITVLVIACPCALGLATPTAIIVGVGKGAEKGILIKDAESLELSQKIQAVVLDKTGTLTEGKPSVSNIFWLKGEKYLVDILYSLEKQSEHPLAEAIVNHLKNSQLIGIQSFNSTTGKGIQAKIDNEIYWVGNQRLLIENQITPDIVLQAKAQEWHQQAQTVVWFANSYQILAMIGIADALKPHSAKAVNELQKMGIEVYMLTGDNQATAQTIAQKVGISHFVAESLPTDKAEFVQKLQNQGKIVAMVGDGINDSAALAQANVSIAMGKGSDIAIDVAKMTIISADLQKIPQAIRLSKQTVATIRQNLFWAFIYNLIGIPIAAGILYPFNGFLLNPMLAGAAMAMSSVSVVSNSLRLKWQK